MRVTMLQDRPVTVDGVHTIDAESGETYEMGDGVAASLVESGAAEYSDGEPENKDAGNAAQTKKTRSRGKKTRSRGKKAASAEPAPEPGPAEPTEED